MSEKEYVGTAPRGYNCFECGACCKVLDVHSIDAIDRDQLNLFSVRGYTIANGYVFIEKKCKYLRNNKCIVQSRKPKACKVFEVGSIACESCRSALGIHKGESKQ